MKRDQDEVDQQSPTAVEEAIRHRAYERYEARGRVDGFELEDWLEAEAEVLGPRKFANVA